MLTEHAQAVQQALTEQGLETPLLSNTLSDKEKKDKIQLSVHEIMNVLGLDLSDDSLRDTPKRIAKMYVEEIFSGLDYLKFPKITVIENKMKVHETIKVSDVSLTSTCEHHFITIDGKAKVAYRPKDRIIGLSKINRLVSFFAQRPQVQERLTQQILIALQVLAQTDDVAVSITATHYCVKARGIKDANSYTTTSSFGGVFNTDSFIRTEFMNN